jgi:hypothetical protein
MATNFIWVGLLTNRGIFFTCLPTEKFPDQSGSSFGGSILPLSPATSRSQAGPALPWPIPLCRFGPRSTLEGRLPACYNHWQWVASPFSRNFNRLQTRRGKVSKLEAQTKILELECWIRSVREAILGPLAASKVIPIHPELRILPPSRSKFYSRSAHLSALPPPASKWRTFFPLRETKISILWLPRTQINTWSADPIRPVLIFRSRKPGKSDLKKSFRFIFLLAANNSSGVSQLVVWVWAPSKFGPFQVQINRKNRNFKKPEPNIPAILSANI